MVAEVLIKQGDKVLARSKNLRGITDYCTKNGPPQYVFTYELAHGEGRLVAKWPHFAGEVRVDTHFSSHRVLMDYISARYTWRGATRLNFPLGSCAADEIDS